jgi:hydroxymethylbilane synthase
MPIGAYAVVEQQTIAMTTIVLSVDGARAARAETRGLAADAHAVGVQAAEQLLALGAGDILAEVQRMQAGSERPA